MSLVSCQSLVGRVDARARAAGVSIPRSVPVIFLEHLERLRYRTARQFRLRRIEAEEFSIARGCAYPHRAACARMIGSPATRLVSRVSHRIAWLPTLRQDVFGYDRCSE